MIDVKSISTHCTRTEFVGTTVLDTIGLVISGIDDTLLKEMNVGMKYHALGLFSSRTGAAGQITAVDDAVKATGTEDRKSVLLPWPFTQFQGKLSDSWQVLRQRLDL